jgi:hypothetical protein
VRWVRRILLETGARRAAEVRGIGCPTGAGHAPNLGQGGQLKRRMWMLRTRPTARNSVRVLDPP